jgi:hypothetical protein
VPLVYAVEKSLDAGNSYMANPNPNDAEQVHGMTVLLRFGVQCSAPDGENVRKVYNLWLPMERK